MDIKTRLVIVGIGLFFSHNILASPSPLNVLSAQVESINKSIEQGDIEKVDQLVSEIKNDAEIPAYLKALFFLRAGEKSAIEDDFQLSIDMYKQVLTLKEELIKQGASLGIYNVSLNVIAHYYFELEQYQIALDYGRKLISEQISAPERRSYSFVAYCEYKLGNYLASLTATETALALPTGNQPDNQVFFIQAAVYEKMDRLDDAIEILTEVYKADPSPELKLRIEQLKRDTAFSFE